MIGGPNDFLSSLDLFMDSLSANTKRKLFASGQIVSWWRAAAGRLAGVGEWASVCEFLAFRLDKNIVQIGGWPARCEKRRPEGIMWVSAFDHFILFCVFAGQHVRITSETSENWVETCHISAGSQWTLLMLLIPASHNTSVKIWFSSVYQNHLSLKAQKTMSYVLQWQTIITNKRLYYYPSVDDNE